MLSVEFMIVPLNLYKATEKTFFFVELSSSFESFPCGSSNMKGNHFPISIPLITVETQPNTIGIIKYI